MTLISAGTIRKLTQPLLFRFWFKRGTRRQSTFRIGWTDLRIYPSVFHPKYFGSSLIFARFVESLDLRNRRFLDMGTGSGIIGLFAARVGAEVTSVDINPDAVRCARDNADNAGVRIRCEQSDLFAALAAQTFDVIAWNPPFFPQPAGTVAEMALYAGDGHATIRRFAEQARSYLTEGGLIYLIFSLDGGLDAVEQIFCDNGFSSAVARTERWGLAETMVILELR
jgi:release factor glutamine methyltransferase